MAKKKQELTVEEKLAAALVREDEWPYKVPGNWVWVFGKYLFEPMTSQKPNGDYFEYIDIDAIDNQTQQVLEPKLVLSSKAPSRARRSLKCGDVLFSLVRPYLKNIAYIDESLEQCIASTGFFVCRPTKIINGRYLYYLMTSELVVCGLNQFMKGDNSPSIRKDDIEGFPFPLPPLAEQQRIVERIESLFDQLDQAKALIQEALDSFATRKAAILHQAFTGALTKKWREEHGVGLESWEEKTLGEFITTQYGYTESAQEEQIGPKFLRITDIQDNTVNWNKVPYCPINENDLLKYSVNKGDIVVARTGATTGKSYLISDEIQAVFASYLIRIKVIDKDCLSEFYLYNFMQSTLYWNQITCFSKGIAQPGVNANKLKDIAITVPSLPEQHEVVRIIDDLFEKEQAAKDLCDQIDQIDTIKKTILGKALRGELGTNEAGEESAVELLKSILYGQH